jgi:sulfur relay (sulfurtransferase) DsrC/TusE family protein
MNAEKQKLLIEYLISSPDTFAICQSILKADYFDPEYKNTIRFIKEYYDKYSSTPTPDQLLAETGQKFKKRTILTQDEIEYC